MSRFFTDRLSAGYGGKMILSDLSFSLESGRILGVLGANGCGKTTLLRSICGIHPCTGRRMLDDEDLSRLSARQIALRCSYIPQRSGISIDLSVLDVVLMGFNPRLGLLRQPTLTMRRTALAALETVGLPDAADHNYQHLSEGQKQLCILARTLVSESSLLLLDEPESALDFHHRHRMLEILRTQIHSGNSMAIVALHDPALALNFCDGLLLLKDGGISGVIRPAADSMETMENLLSGIYGPVSLSRCTDRRNRSHIVMLKEQEGYT